MGGESRTGLDICLVVFFGVLAVLGAVDGERIKGVHGAAAKGVAEQRAFGHEGDGFIKCDADDEGIEESVGVIRDDEQSVFGFPSDDIDMLDELVTAPILEAGRYFVEVSAGSSFDGAHSSYEVLVVLE